MSSAAVGTLIRRPKLIGQQVDQREVMDAGDLLVGKRDLTALRRTDKRIAAVACHAGQKTSLEIVADHILIIGRRELGYVVHRHVFDAGTQRRVPEATPLPAERDAAAFTLLIILVVNTREIIQAVRHAVGRVKQVRLTKGGHVLLNLRTGHRLNAELLTGAAPGRAVEEVAQAGRWIHDVEVALVEYDAAGQTAVRVDADPENQATGVGFVHINLDVLVDAVIRPKHLDRGRRTVLAAGENAQAGQVVLGHLQVGIGEDLAGEQGNLTEDDVLPRPRVADDKYLPHAGHWLLHDLILHVAHPWHVLRPHRDGFHANILAVVTEIVLDALHVRVDLGLFEIVAGPGLQ